MAVILLLFILVHISSASKCIRNYNSNFEKTVNIRNASLNYRLPQHIVPISYNITLEPRLEPNLNPAIFTGRVSIDMEAVENADNITLHSFQLNVTEDRIHLVDYNDSEIKLLNTTWDSQRQFYIIRLRTPLIKGHKYKLLFEHYEGILNLDREGFYLAKYYDEDGNERRMATTQFQCFGARRAFPSFDEPHLKAVFRIGVIRDSRLISISNEEILFNKTLEGGKVMDVYKETPIMSTYLVAIVVSDYIHTKQLKKQRVFGKKMAILQGDGEYALQTGVKAIETFEKFLSVSYSLNKLDQVAIPGDFFAPGAMENWGLVTYREKLLIYPKHKATTRQIYRTHTIIVHEYAHMWFGNLVTCGWWKYIWLNEGFATYLHYYISSLMEPTWRLMDVFVLESLQFAMKGDALNVTKPMNYEPEDSPGITAIWVAYQKASSIIRMFEHFLTHRIFKKALTIYLRNNAYKSVQPSDLYEVLQKVTDDENATYLLGNYSVSEILETWDSQAGYPIVNVTRNYTTGDITLRQRRFWLNENEAIGDNIWYIPINFKFHSLKDNSNKTTADFWMTKREQIVNQDFPSTDWLIVNKQQTGFYGVNYDTENWHRLISFLNEGNIHDVHVLNRAQLIYDSFNLAQVGQLQYEIALELSKYLRRESDYVPLTAFFNAMPFLKELMSATKEFPLFQKYINEVTGKAYNDLEFDEKDSDVYMDKMNRINILHWRCDSANFDCRQQSLNALRKWQTNDSASIAPNLENPVFCGAMRIGNEDDWNFLYRKYEAARNSSQGVSFLNALACSENTTILEKFLNKTLDVNGTLKVDHRAYVFTAISKSGNVGLNVTFEYIKRHFEPLNQTDLMPTILMDTIDLFTTEEQLDQLLTLVPNKPPYKGCIDNLKDKIRRNKRYIPSIRKWFRSQFNTGESNFSNVLLFNTPSP